MGWFKKKKNLWYVGVGRRKREEVFSWHRPKWMKSLECYYNLLCDKFQVAFCHGLGHTRMDSGPFRVDITVPSKKGRDPSWKLASCPSNTPLTPAKYEMGEGGINIILAITMMPSWKTGCFLHLLPIPAIVPQFSDFCFMTSATWHNSYFETISWNLNHGNTHLPTVYTSTTWNNSVSLRDIPWVNPPQGASKPKNAQT